MTREDMISQIMAITPTNRALDAIEILDGTPDKGVKNILSEVGDSQGQAIWLGLLNNYNNNN